MLMVQKQQYQDWMGMFSFTHRIDVEPSPSHPLSFDELCQRLRKILFDMNKKHLSRRWEKRKPEDKFWVMGFKEGDTTGNQHQLHYHLLLHSPKNHDANIWDDLHFGWMKSPSKNPVNGKNRKMLTHRKDAFHLGNEELIEHLPLQIQEIRSKVGSIKYASKKMHQYDYDDHFVIGVEE